MNPRNSMSSSRCQYLSNNVRSSSYSDYPPQINNIDPNDGSIFPQSPPMSMAEFLRKRKADAQRRRRQSMSPAMKEKMKKKAAEDQRRRRAKMSLEEKEKERRVDRERYALKRYLQLTTTTTTTTTTTDTLSSSSSYSASPPDQHKNSLRSKYQFLTKKDFSNNNKQRLQKPNNIQIENNRKRSSYRPVFEHFVGGNGPTREHPDPLPVRPMNMLQSTAGYAEAGPSNQGYTGKPETSRRKKIATATVSSETVLIPDDSPPQPTAPKLQKKQIDDRRFDERRFEEQQRFQERRFENRRFDERRQQMAAAVQSAQVAAPSLQIPPQMQVKQHLQVAPPPPPPLQAPRQVQVLAPPPVQVPVPKPKPVEKPRPREKRIFVVADHQRCVMSNLASLWKSGKLCDAGIGNGSSTVMVHKVVLSAVCPKLLSVFSTDILSHKFLQVNFPEEVSTEALNAFAEYMYNGILDLDPDILQQLKIIAKRLDMKEFEQLCDSHLPNQHHQPVAAAATSSISFNNLPLIQTSVPIIPSIPTSHQTSLSSLNISTSSLPSVPSITTQVIDVKQEISEAELDQVKKDTAAVFGEESQVVSLAPNQSGNAGFVISPSIKTEPIGPEDDKYGRLGAAGKTNSSNNQVYTSSSSISAVPSSSISSLSTAAFVPPSSSSLTSSSILSSIPTSSTEYAIPFTDTIDIKTTELKLTPTTASTTYVTPSLMPDLSSVTSIVEAVCSQPSAMNEDSTKPLTQQQPSLSAMSSSSSALEGPSLSSSGHDNIYPVGLFTAEGDNLPLLTTQTVGIKTIDLYKTDLT